MSRLAAVGLAAILSGSPAPQQRQDPIKSSVDLVQVDAVVLGSDGTPIPGLQRSDFQLFVEGQPVPIQTFVPVTPDDKARGGRFVVLLLDDLLSDPIHTWRIKQIARGFVSRMGPADEIAVLAINGSRMKSTTDRESLLTAVDRFTHHGRNSTLQLQHIGRHALETIQEITAQMAPVQGRRKSIVCIGSQGLFDIREPDPTALTPRAEWIEAVRAAAAWNVSVYVIDPRGLAGGTNDGVSGLAGETGGRAFVNTNQFDRAVDQIWREIGTYYLLGFDATALGVGDDLREIQVRVSVPGADVKARRSVAVSSTSAPARQP